MVLTLDNLSVVPLNNTLGGRPIGLILLDGGATVGAIVVSILLSCFRGAAAWTSLLVNLSLALSTAALYLVGIAGHIALAAFFMFCIGGATVSISVGLDSALQLRTRQEFLGRTAMMQDAFMSWVAAALVPFLGSAIDELGVRTTLRIGAGIPMAYLAIALLFGTRLIFGPGLYTQQPQTLEMPTHIPASDGGFSESS